MTILRAEKFIFARGILLFVLFFLVNSDETCDIEIENTLKSLLTPQEFPTIQQQALRKDLLRRFQEALDRTTEDDYNYKRSLSSLARWNNLPDKRNIEALARAGYIRTLPDPSNEDPNPKRSIATLAKNGQLPTFQNNESKRGIESLARNGELHNRKEVQDLLDELYSKRNIGNLARNYNFPSYGKRYLGSLVRNNGKYVGKRSIALPISNPLEKSEKRSKRQVGYYESEYPSPVYQNDNVEDYEELLKALTEAYPNNAKRFLGRLPQMGKPKTTPTPKTRYH